MKMLVISKPIKVKIDIIKIIKDLIYRNLKFSDLLTCINLLNYYNKLINLDIKSKYIEPLVDLDNIKLLSNFMNKYSNIPDINKNFDFLKKCILDIIEVINKYKQQNPEFKLDEHIEKEIKLFVSLTNKRKK